MEAVRAKLSDHRARCGLNFEQAGRRAGISGQWWRVLETGQQNITRTRLITMAKAVEWPPNEALTLAGMPTLLPAEAHQLAGDPRERLEELLARLSDARVRALLYVARTMIDPDAADYQLDVAATDPTVRTTHKIVDTAQGDGDPSIPNSREGNGVTS